MKAKVMGTTGKPVYLLSLGEAYTTNGNLVMADESILSQVRDFFLRAF